MKIKLYPIFKYTCLIILALLAVFPFVSVGRY